MLTASDLIPPAWKWGAAAVLTLGLLALFTWQHLALKSAQEALETEKSAHGKCAYTLGVQSLQVRAWKTRSDELAAAYETARQGAAQARARAEDKARAIYALNLPQDECHALATLVDTARGPAHSLRLPIAPE